MNKNMKYVIWDELEDVESWICDYCAEYPEDCEGKTDDEMYRMMQELNASYLDDERMNLSGICTPGEIIVLGTIGLWNGPRFGYKRLYTTEVSDILQPLCNSMSYCTFGSDGYNIVGRESHHDGTNYYTYRFLRPGVDAENFFWKIQTGKANKNMINYYTGSLVPYVHSVYGWKIPKQFTTAGGNAR